MQARVLIASVYLRRPLLCVRVCVCAVPPALHTPSVAPAPVACVFVGTPGPFSPASHRMSAPNARRGDDL